MHSSSSGTTRTSNFADSNAGVAEKGSRLARIVGQRRSLLILDGLEPLQSPPGLPLDRRNYVAITLRVMSPQRLTEDQNQRQQNVSRPL